MKYLIPVGLLLLYVTGWAVFSTTRLGLCCRVRPAERVTMWQFPSDMTAVIHHDKYSIVFTTRDGKVHVVEFKDKLKIDGEVVE